MTKIHRLHATSQTVKWGYFDKSWVPVLSINSGDFVDIEAICHQSGDAPELLMDDAITDIFNAFPRRNMGDHIITGPIFIEEAEPGDTLEVKILDMKPRLLYGSNVLANWGELAEEFDYKEHIIIYRVDEKENVAIPEFTYLYPGKIENPGQIRYEHEVDRKPINQNIKVPLNLHFGIAGVTPNESGKVDSTHPRYFGGNVDNKNYLMGTSMYFKVNNKGAGFYVGDSHFAQGDGELSGTAIEGSVNGRIQLIVHKNFHIKENPILETSEYWMTHGFDKNLNKAAHKAAVEAVDFLVEHMNTEPTTAYSVLAVAGNFHISQVANEVHGVHCMIRKNYFG